MDKQKRLFTTKEKNMKEQNLRKIWGNDLYEILGHHMDEEGWLTAEWATILENELKDWDEYMRQTDDKSTAYSYMYNIDFEENEDGTKIRRTDIPTH